MDPFNKTLWDELQGSGVLKMVAKSLYPLNVPQVPGDFKPPTTIAPLRRGEAPRVQNNGPWLTDWSGPPVNANYLAFGYTGAQGGQLVLYGWLFNLAQPDPATRAGDREAVLRLARRGRREESGARVRRRHPATVRRQEPGRDQDLFRFRPHRRERNLVDGLRRVESAARSRTITRFRACRRFRPTENWWRSRRMRWEIRRS